ncbi:MAG: PIN domain nuclease [Spirochaetes bacterium]|nr:PIN domain nuclease [Spirochaetota bacterium]
MIILLRVLFILISIGVSFLCYFDSAIYVKIIAAAASALISFILIILIEYVSHTFSSRTILASVFGLLVGLILGHLIAAGISYLPLPFTEIQNSNVKAVIYHLIIFSMMIFFVIHQEELSIIDKIIPEKKEKLSEGEITYKILDTSTIIDGRIFDICDTGFIEGILVVPNFVVNELQMVADSKDSIKRNRGRRGLDILNKMQKDKVIMIKITDKDYPDIPEVDDKLVKLAGDMDAKLITNDFNLNKVAEVHGVPVLNINDLSNALKPIVLPGEKVTVALVKEGKDQSQAIGYLDDGTMVVAENGKKMLNKEVELEVTSVLQTTAGRMIFAKLNK